MTDQGLDAAVVERLATFERDKIVERIWQHDRTVWTDDPHASEIVDRLGWLDLPASMAPQVAGLQTLADDIAGAFDRVVLLGMGGSSLASEVLVRSIGRQRGFPVFRMLDSTHPSAVLDIEQSGDLDRTLFIVASKSGTTLETMAFFSYFWERTGRRGEQFIAITDQATPLEALALERRFRKVLVNPSDIGGRFSALSLFGLLPAALAGLDTECLRVRAEGMATQCRVAKPADNPGVALGAWLGEAALRGRDKLLLNADDPVALFGLWADQLVAESTGKDGRGILPVTGWTGESPPADHIRVTVGRDPSRPGEDGIPTQSIELDDGYDLAAEFFRWEFATAVASAVIGVNPFDQPDVAASKKKTAAVLEAAVARDDPRPTRKSVIQGFIDDVKPGDYIAVSAWVPPSAERDVQLEDLRNILVERFGVAVTVAYGPRFLHSTGQLHKGGPATGHFVQLLDPEPEPLQVPGMAYTFGDLIHAQALGDYEALTARGRPVLQLTDVDYLLETI